MSKDNRKGYWGKDGNTWHAPSLKKGHCTCGWLWDEGCAQEEHINVGESVLKGAKEASESAQNKAIKEFFKGIKLSTGAKDDSNKPEMRYFYFPGYIAIHYNDMPESAVELGARFHSDVLMSLVNNKDTGKLLDGLRSFEQSIFNEHIDGSLDRKDLQKGISTVGKLGATKYGFLNYTKGFVWSRLLDAMARHVYEYMEGRTIDPESGLDHRYHVLANIYMLAEHMENETGVNDLITEESE